MEDLRKSLCPKICCNFEMFRNYIGVSTVLDRLAFPRTKRDAETEMQMIVADFRSPGNESNTYRSNLTSTTLFKRDPSIQPRFLYHLSAFGERIGKEILILMSRQSSGD